MISLVSKNDCANADIKSIDDFLANPTNRASNYEKLSFIDDKLRSIRVSDKYRVILGDLNNALYLLHVDNHDAAYSWGEKKRIDKGIIESKIKLYSDVEEVENQSLLKSESEKKGKTQFFGDIRDEDLETIGLPIEWIPKVKGIVDIRSSKSPSLDCSIWSCA